MKWIRKTGSLLVRRIPEKWRFPLGVELFMLIVLAFVTAQIYRMEYRALAVSAEWTMVRLTEWDLESGFYEMDNGDAAVGILNRIVASLRMEGADYEDVMRNSSLIVEITDENDNVTASTSPENKLLFWLDEEYRSHVIKLDEVFDWQEIDRLEQYVRTNSKGVDAELFSVMFRYMDGYYDAEGNWVTLVVELANSQTEELITLESSAYRPEDAQIVRYCTRVLPEDFDDTSSENFIHPDVFRWDPDRVVLADSWTYLWNNRGDLYAKATNALDQRYTEVVNTFGLVDYSRATMESGREEDLLLASWHAPYEGAERGRLAWTVDLNRLVLVSDYFRSTWILTAFFLQFVTVLGIWNYRIYEKKKKELQETRNTFLNAMAHELKTPAAIIKNSVECVEEGIHPEKDPHYLKVIKKEADHVSGLVNHMLIYTRVSGPEYSLKWEKVILQDLLAEAEREIEELKAGKDIRLEQQIPQEQTLTCDRNLMLLVLENFLANAVEYCPKDGVIRIRWEENTLSVYNSGSKIAEKDLPHIWDPLYRGDDSRSTDSDSSGMGLAICASILKLHGARYGAVNREDGVEFFFTGISDHGSCRFL